MTWPRAHSPRASWLVALLVLAVYLPTCAVLPQAGDALEFLMIASHGGVAHPPGYPVFSLAARAFAAVLPNVSFAVSALSAVLGAATAGVLHRAVLRATDDGVAAAFVALVYATSTLVWRWAVVPEVLSGGTLTAALVLLAAVHVARGARGPRAAAALGLAFATGIAHHHTSILLMPLMVWTWIAAWPRPFTPRAIAATTATAVLCAWVGLLPYATLLLPGGDWRWGNTTELPGLVHHFLRGDYGTLDTGQPARNIALHVQPMLYLTSLARQLAGLPLLLGIAGLGLAFKARTGRGFAAALAATWLFAGPIFVARFDLPATGYHRMVVERFHGFPTVLFAFAMGYGVTAFRALPFWSRPALPTGLLALNLLVAAALSAPAATARNHTITDDFLRNTLGAVEPNAVILTTGDSFQFGCEFAQSVLHLRDDVACVAAGLVPYDWYRRRTLEQHPELTLTRPDGRPLSAAQLAAAFAVQRPTYVSSRLPLASPDLPLPPYYPAAGSLLRISSGELPTPPELEAALLRDWTSFQLGSRLTVDQLDTAGDSTLWDQYALTWSTLASGYAAGGDTGSAERCRARARELSPWLFDLDVPAAP